MKGQKSNCNVCGKEFIKKMNTQVNCSAKCTTKSSSMKSAERMNVNKFKIMDRDGFRCFYCGKAAFESEARLVLDHVIPITQGGKTTKENLVTCCTECNCAKLGMIISDGNLKQIQSEINRRNQAYRGGH